MWRALLTSFLVVSWLTGPVLAQEGFRDPDGGSPPELGNDLEYRIEQLSKWCAQTNAVLSQNGSGNAVFYMVNANRGVCFVENYNPPYTVVNTNYGYNFSLPPGTTPAQCVNSMRATGLHYCR